jgi:hypothetical protein
MDDESVIPTGLAATSTGMQVRAYIAQSSTDWTPRLFARNRENIQKMRAAMNGIAPPIAVSEDSTVWAIPHQTGDTQYVTVVNWGYEEGRNASQFVKPQKGALKWNTTRPIYDLRSGKKLSPQEAQTVDLTRDAFQVFVLPSAEPKELRLERRPAYKTAEATINVKVLDEQGKEITGLPLQIEARSGTNDLTLFAESGRNVLWSHKLSSYDWKLTDLATGVRHETRAEMPSQFIGGGSLTQPHSGFAIRTEVPLVIALTPEQQNNAHIKSLAEKLAAFYKNQGRKVETRTLAPGDVVLSLQPLRNISAPRWKTIDADLVLLGDANINPLIFDQLRAGILSPAAPNIAVTHSPFSGEYQALNILARSEAELIGIVNALAR